MKDDRLLDDDSDLKAAFRSVRDAYDGTSEQSNATLQRALFQTRVRERRSRVTRWVVLPIAAVFAASTAWAGVTGKLAPAVQSVLESFHLERPEPPPVVATGPARAVTTTSTPLPEPTPEPATAQAEPESEPVREPEPSTPAPLASEAPKPVAHAQRSGPPAASAPAPMDHAHVSAPAPEPAPAPSASANDPNAALFAEAHRLHFIDRDPARALAAWDRYLAAAPNGRFSPEARYNRAIALVRLGRHAEAKSELQAFANGTYGSYRRDEAKALLEALAGDAAP